MGPVRPQPLAAGTAPMTEGPVRLGPGLIEEHEPARIKLALRALPLSPPVRDVRPVLLGGRLTFF